MNGFGRGTTWQESSLRAERRRWSELHGHSDGRSDAFKPYEDCQRNGRDRNEGKRTCGR